MKMISRRDFIRLTAATGLAGILGSGYAPRIASGQDKPNIVFITIDALRADHLGCYGYHRDTSPNMDALARNSILFKNFFTVVPKTGPSMTTFFTGKYIQNHGVVGNQMEWNSSIQPFMELMPKEYKKAAIVANTILLGSKGYDRGFDIYAYNDDEELTLKAIHWLDTFFNRACNFFLWLHYLDPHGPYKPPAEFHEIFVNDQYYDASRKVTLDYTPIKGYSKNTGLGVVPAYQRLGDINEVDYYVAQYDAEIKHIDSEVGKLLSFLEQKKQMDNTIIIISADHGESLGENNYYFEHGMLVNESSIHIPLIISHPEVREHLAVNSLLQNTDLAPTILGEIGSEFSAEIDGVDFSEAYHNRKPDYRVRDFIYSCTPHEYPDFFETIRTATGKLIRTNEDAYSFFNIAKDKFETEDTFSEAGRDSIGESMSLMENFGKRHMKSASKTTLSEEEVEKLKALGYID